MPILTNFSDIHLTQLTEQDALQTETPESNRK